MVSGMAASRRRRGCRCPTSCCRTGCAIAPAWSSTPLPPEAVPCRSPLVGDASASRGRASPTSGLLQGCRGACPRMARHPRSLPMALSLLAALIALGLLHLLPQLSQWRGDGVFRGWVRQLDDTAGRGRVLLTLVVPAVLCLLLAELLGRVPLGGFLQLAFAAVVLLYGLGPHSFEADLEAVLH